MGFFKHSKKPKQTDEGTPPEETPESNNVGSPKLRKKSSIKRLSSESMKRSRLIREVGKCLRIIGDDVERRSSTGSVYDIRRNSTGV